MSVGSDILDANGGSDIIAIKDNLDAIWLIAELIVMSSGAGNGGRVFVWYEADGTTMAGEEALILHGELPGVFGISFGGIIRKTECNFAVGEVKEIVGEFFLEYAGAFDTAADASKVWLNVGRD